jgi:hypothetical protein
VNEQAIDRSLMRAFRGALEMSAEREDDLWSQFSARRDAESAAWVAFAASMMLLSAGLQPAIRSSAWPASFGPRQ